MNPRSARELILRGDSLTRAGRLHDAHELYLQSIAIVTDVKAPGPEPAADQAAGIALTRAIGHERVGLIRTWLGDPEDAAGSFAASQRALQEGAANIGDLPPAQAALVEELRAEAPRRWREAQRLRTEPPAVDLALSTKLCEHGCLSKSGLCRGHPPDPCW